MLAVNMVDRGFQFCTRSIWGVRPNSGYLEDMVMYQIIETCITVDWYISHLTLSNGTF